MDLLHDRLDDEGKAISRTDQVLLKLAEEALVAPGGFISELKWLVPGEAKNGYRFGHAVGHLDLSREVWPNIRQAYYEAESDANVYFVGGYLRAIFERDTEAWEQIVFAIANDGRKPEYLPGLIWRSGMSDNAAQLLCNSLAPERFGPKDLASLLSVERARSYPTICLRSGWIS